MRLSRGDFQPLAGAENKLVAFDFEHQLAFEHKEELARMAMQVALLVGS